MNSKYYTLGEGQEEGNGRWDDKIYPGCRTRLLEAEHFQGDCFTTSVGAFLHAPFRAESTDPILSASFQWQKLCNMLAQQLMNSLGFQL